MASDETKTDKNRADRWYGKDDKKPKSEGAADGKDAGKGGDGKEGDGEAEPMTMSQRHTREREEAHKRHKKAREEMAALHETELADIGSRHEKELGTAAKSVEGDAGKAPANAGESAQGNAEAEPAAS